MTKLELALLIAAVCVVTFALFELTPLVRGIIWAFAPYSEPAP